MLRITAECRADDFSDELCHPHQRIRSHEFNACMMLGKYHGPIPDGADARTLHNTVALMQRRTREMKCLKIPAIHSFGFQDLAEHRWPRPNSDLSSLGGAEFMDLCIEYTVTFPRFFLFAVGDARCWLFHNVIECDVCSDACYAASSTMGNGLPEVFGCACY